MEIILMLLGVILMIGLLIIYFSFSWGLVLSCFWSWFLLPIFPNLPEITYLNAIGLMLLIGLFNKSVNNSNSIKKSYIDENKKNTNMITMFVQPWITLLIGYLIKIIIY